MDSVEDYAKNGQSGKKKEEADTLSESVKAVRSLIQIQIGKLGRKFLRSPSQFGGPLRNIHISNDSGSLTFYVDVFFPLSLSKLLPDLTVYMNNTAGVLLEAETAYPSRTTELTPRVFFWS